MLIYLQDSQAGTQHCGLMVQTIAVLGMALKEKLYFEWSVMPKGYWKAQSFARCQGDKSKNFRSLSSSSIATKNCMHQAFPEDTVEPPAKHLSNMCNNPKNIFSYITTMLVLYQSFRIEAIALIQE
jgi:hypothetical protein